MGSEEKAEVGAKGLEAVAKGLDEDSVVEAAKGLKGLVAAAGEEVWCMEVAIQLTAQEEVGPSLSCTADSPKRD